MLTQLLCLSTPAFTDRWPLARRCQSSPVYTSTCLNWQVAARADADANALSLHLLNWQVLARSDANAFLKYLNLFIGRWLLTLTDADALASLSLLCALHVLGTSRAHDPYLPYGRRFDVVSVSLSPSLPTKGQYSYYTWKRSAAPLSQHVPSTHLPCAGRATGCSRAGTSHGQTHAVFENPALPFTPACTHAPRLDMRSPLLTRSSARTCRRQTRRSSRRGSTRGADHTLSCGQQQHIATARSTRAARTCI